MDLAIEIRELMSVVDKLETGSQIRPVLKGRLLEMLKAVEERVPPTYDINGFEIYRPIYELRDGEVFLDSSYGLRYMKTCHYFVNTWWPAHKDEFEKEK